jgi:hypothetical protein
LEFKHRKEELLSLFHKERKTFFENERIKALLLEEQEEMEAEQKF